MAPNDIDQGEALHVKGDESSQGEYTEVRPNAFYVPSPVLFYGTRALDGTPNVSTMSAVGVVCLDPPLVAVGVKPSRRSYKNSAESREFTLSLPHEGQLEAADFVGTRKLRHVPDKLQLADIDLVDLDRVNAPGVADAPILMGCEVVDLLGRNELGFDAPLSHHVVIGRMVECRVDPNCVRDEEVRLEEIMTLLYFNRYYLGSGKILERQRYTDDPIQQNNKMNAYRRIL